MSEAAAGTLARILTFVTTRKGAILKKRLTQRDAKSPKQHYRRWMFTFLQKNWPALELVDQNSWSDVASFFEWTLNNAYLRENLMRWDRFDVPSAYLPIQQTGAPGTLLYFVAAMDNQRVKLRIKLNDINQNWGTIVYAARVFPPTKHPQHVFMVGLQNSILERSYYYYPEATGLHQFSFSFFSHNGERWDYPVNLPVWVP